MMPKTISYQYKSIFFALFLLMVSCNKNNSIVIAWVDQHPISNSEFEHWVLLHRAEVHNYFYKAHKTADSEDFWEKEIEGESPLEMLKNLALDEAVRCKVQQIMALEKDIVEHIDFDQMILEMQEENQKRKMKIEKGEVVYGAKNYTKRTYFAHEFDKMLIKLKTELLKDELKPSTYDLEALIKDEDFPLEENNGFYQLQYVEAKYDHYIDSITNAIELKINKQNWNSVNAFFN